MLYTYMDMNGMGLWMWKTLEGSPVFNVLEWSVYKCETYFFAFFFFKRPNKENVAGIRQEPGSPVLVNYPKPS